MAELTKEQKEAAKLELRTKLTAHKLDTFDHWLTLMEYDENMRKACGYSKGTDDMLQKLVKTYRKESSAMMKPFDRGDFD